MVERVGIRRLMAFTDPSSLDSATARDFRGLVTEGDLDRIKTPSQGEVAPSCPLCGSAEATAEGSEQRRFWRCRECNLVFLDPNLLPTPEAELAHYLTHENDPADHRYRDFLSRVADPLLEVVREGATGLDYGAGPGPTLSRMLSERGRPTADFDPFFANDSELLDRQYDFVACTETVEHFHRPRAEFERLDGLVRPGGTLAVMTELLREGVAVADWWYARDPTHVSLFSKATLEWIAGRFHYDLDLPRQNVAMFRKGSGDQRSKGGPV